MWASRETMETHRLEGGSTSWLLVSWIKRPLPFQLWLDIHQQGEKKKEWGLLLPVPSTHVFLFFFFWPFFVSFSSVYPLIIRNLFYITGLSLWNNREGIITFPRVAVFSQGEEKGEDSDDKGTLVSVKSQPLWSYSPSFWPFQEETSVFHYLAMEFFPILFLRFYMNKGWSDI